jgi:hypothetical protein
MRRKIAAKKISAGMISTSSVRAAVVFVTRAFANLLREAV